MGFKNQTLLLLIFCFLMSCSQKSEWPKVKGKITISPNIERKLSASDVIYLFAYRSISDSQPESLSSKQKIDKNDSSPLTIIKFAPAKFPQEFEMSEKDLLFPPNEERSLKGKFLLYALLSKSGKTEKELGDFQSDPRANLVELGMSGIKIEINQEVEGQVENTKTTVHPRQ